MAFSYSLRSRKAFAPVSTAVSASSITTDTSLKVTTTKRTLPATSAVPSLPSLDVVELPPAGELAPTTSSRPEKRMIIYNKSVPSNVPIITVPYKAPIDVRIFCTCKKNRCVKLYCVCFAHGKTCMRGMCSCTDCENLQNTSVATTTTTTTTTTTGTAPVTCPHAIPKLDVAPSCNDESDSSQSTTTTTTATTTTLYRKLRKDSCSCRRGQCTMKYCGCLRRGVQCGPSCECVGCGNCTEALLSVRRKNTMLACDNLVPNKRVKRSARSTEVALLSDESTSTTSETTPPSTIAVDDDIFSVCNIDLTRRDIVEGVYGEDGEEEDGKRKAEDGEAEEERDVHDDASSINTTTACELVDMRDICDEKILLPMRFASDMSNVNAMEEGASVQSATLDERASPTVLENQLSDGHSIPNTPESVTRVRTGHITPPSSTRKRKGPSNSGTKAPHIRPSEFTRRKGYPRQALDDALRDGWWTLAKSHGAFPFRFTKLRQGLLSAYSSLDHDDKRLGCLKGLNSEAIVSRFRGGPNVFCNEARAVLKTWPVCRYPSASNQRTVQLVSVAPAPASVWSRSLNELRDDSHFIDPFLLRDASEFQGAISAITKHIRIYAKGRVCELASLSEKPEELDELVKRWYASAFRALNQSLDVLVDDLRMHVDENVERWPALVWNNPNCSDWKETILPIPCNSKHLTEAHYEMMLSCVRQWYSHGLTHKPRCLCGKN